MKRRLHRNFFSWVFFHFLEFFWFYLFALICLFALHTFQAKLPGLAKNLGDGILSQKVDNSEVKWFVLLAGAIFFFRTLSRWLFFYPARVQQKNLRLEVIELIQKSSPLNYLDYGPGQIYQILYNDFNRLRGFIGFALLQIGNIIIASYVLIPKIREIDPGIFIVFIPTVASILIFSLVIFIFQPYLQKAINLQADVQSTIIETFDAKNSIASFQKEESFKNNFSKASYLELQNFFKASVGPSIARPLIPLGVSLSLLWGAILIRDMNLSVTYLILFSGFLFLVLEPLMFLAWIGIIFAGAMGSWKRVKSFLFMLGQEENPLGEVVKAKGMSVEVTQPFRGENIHFSFEEGKIIGVCGATGSGKSTLLINTARLLIKEKAKVSLVMQEPHLFDDTVENNICLGRDLSKDERKTLIELIKIFNLDQLGETDESILSTDVGENGKKLSGGQIKRLSLIRSLMSQADFLIWDDPFSSVDNILESQIFRNLKKKGFLKNKSLLFSSHRKTTFRFADEAIMVFENGKIIKELIEGPIRNKEINEFFKLQMVEVL